MNSKVICLINTLILEQIMPFRKDKNNEATPFGKASRLLGKQIREYYLRTESCCTECSSLPAPCTLLSPLWPCGSLGQVGVFPFAGKETETLMWSDCLKLCATLAGDPKWDGLIVIQQSKALALSLAVTIHSGQPHPYTWGKASGIS